MRDELDIIESTANLKCGKAFVVKIDSVRPLDDHHGFIIRVYPKDDVQQMMIASTCHSNLSEMCEIAEVLKECLLEDYDD